jgi:hypothetical protein
MKVASFFILLAVIIFNSCTIILPLTVEPDKTHKEVMDKFQTKMQVFARYGMPTKKDVIDGIEIYYYYLGSTSNSTTRAYSYSFNPNALNSPNTLFGKSNTTTIPKYVEFHFIDDKIVNWRSGGVNYGTNRKSQNRLYGLTIDVLIGLVWAASFRD